MKIRVKTIFLEAIQFDGHNEAEIFAWMGFAYDDAPSHPEGFSFQSATGTDQVRVHDVRVNDWVVKGIKGDFFSCTPGYFAKHYAPAEEPACAV